MSDTSRETGLCQLQSPLGGCQEALRRVSICVESKMFGYEIMWLGYEGYVSALHISYLV